MCYFNGCRVSKDEFIRLMELEKQLKEFQLNRPAQNGFEYRDWPILVPAADHKSFDLVNAHWEFIPGFIHDEQELKEARIMNTWLNAKGETLFVNDKGRLSMFREGAKNGRCLVLSTGFYEYRHIPKLGKKGQPLKATEKVPYRIGIQSDREYFFMAGVSRQWTNITRGQSALTFAVVTTRANALMEQVHNSRKRMPVILPDELAAEWLLGNLSEQRILELASYQYPPDKMYAYPVDKKFLESPEPERAAVYEQLPALL